MKDSLLKIQEVLVGRKAEFLTEDLRKLFSVCNPISYLKAQHYVHFYSGTHNQFNEFLKSPNNSP